MKTQLTYYNTIVSNVLNKKKVKSKKEKTLFCLAKFYKDGELYNNLKQISLNENDYIFPNGTINEQEVDKLITVIDTIKTPDVIACLKNLNLYLQEFGKTDPILYADINEYFDLLKKYTKIGCCKKPGMSLLNHIYHKIEDYVIKEARKEVKNLPDNLHNAVKQSFSKIPNGIIEQREFEDRIDVYKRYINYIIKLRGSVDANTCSNILTLITYNDSTKSMDDMCKYKDKGYTSIFKDDNSATTTQFTHSHQVDEWKKVLTYLNRQKKITKQRMSQNNELSKKEKEKLIDKLKDSSKTKDEKIEYLKTKDILKSLELVILKEKKVGNLNKFIDEYEGYEGKIGEVAGKARVLLLFLKNNTTEFARRNVSISKKVVEQIDSKIEILFNDRINELNKEKEKKEKKNAEMNNIIKSAQQQAQKKIEELEKQLDDLTSMMKNVSIEEETNESIVEMVMEPENVEAIKPANKSKTCNPNSDKAKDNKYICNPDSGRWILRTSAAGKKILKSK